MQIIRVFLDFYWNELNDGKRNKLSALLKQLPGVETVMISGQSDPSVSLAEIEYDNSILSVDVIEAKIKETGAIITEINIHFPPAITHVSDPYGASAVSIDVIDSIKLIKGVFGAGISSSGVITVTIDAKQSDKQDIINIIINAIESSK